MNAILVEGPSLRWGTAPDPAPSRGEVAIAVAATALNRADLLQRRGMYPAPEGASPVLGLECSGTIAAIGEGVEGYEVGDRVAALLSGGGYAEIAVCPASQLLPVPERLDLLHAAALPEALATAWMALRLVGRLAAGERVLLHAGASGIGTAMIQICRAWGNPCFATVGSEDKRARCLALGAGGAALREGWERAAGAWAPGGFDVIVDPVGGAYLPRDQGVLARGGRVALLGLMGGASAQIDLARMLLGHQQITGTTLRSRSVSEKAEILSGVLREIWPHVVSGEVVPVIDRLLPIARAEEAHAVMERNETFGKIVLSIPT